MMGIEEKQYNRNLKILVISSGIIAKKMAGPGIRYWEIAKVLRKYMKVTLAIPNNSDIDIDKEPNIEIINYNSCPDFENIIVDVEYILIQGSIVRTLPILKKYKYNKKIIVDLYDPFTIENLEVNKYKPLEEQSSIQEDLLSILDEQLEIGDYFICASERQKTYWIGMLEARGKITPALYLADSTLNNLIGIVPFGISSTLPQQDKKVLKGKYKGINKNDFVIIWGGGVWNWFDPITLIKAMSNICAKRNDVKLFFLGVHHPNPYMPKMEMSNKAIALARQLGLEGKYVFFNYEWIPYEERHNYLLEADIGVSCHFNNVETMLSFRTRILDYLWSKIPIVATQGDFFADLIAKEELGKVVEPENVEQLTETILQLVENKALREKCVDSIERVRKNYFWENVVEPIVNYCNKHTNSDVRTNKRGKSIVDIEVSDMNATVGELVHKKQYGQRFRCRHSNLYKISLMIATYGRINNHEVTLYLREDNRYGQILAQKIFDASTLNDNSWLNIEFNPIINSAGRHLYLSIETHGADYGNSITLWMCKQTINYAGQLYENNKKVSGCLCFKTHCLLTRGEISDKNIITLQGDYEVAATALSKNEETLNGIDDNFYKIIMKQKSRNRALLELQEKIDVMEEDIINVNTNIQNINTWIQRMDNRISKLKKAFPLNFMKKIFNKLT